MFTCEVVSDFKAHSWLTDDAVLIIRIRVMDSSCFFFPPLSWQWQEPIASKPNKIFQSHEKNTGKEVKIRRLKWKAGIYDNRLTLIFCIVHAVSWSWVKQWMKCKVLLIINEWTIKDLQFLLPQRKLNEDKKCVTSFSFYSLYCLER